MKTSNNGIALIKEFEGFRSAPYLDAVGVPTIGYGNTFYDNGQPVLMKDDAITEAQATRLMLLVLAKFETGVNDAVKVPLNQYQFDALVSLAYNIGLAAFKSSTLLERLNAGLYKDAAEQFLRWVYADKVVLKGLQTRRQKEKTLFLMAVDKQEFEMTDTKKWYESSTIKSALVTLLTMIASLFSIDFGDITTLIDLIQQTVVQGVAIVMSISAIVGRVKAVTRIVK